METDKKMYEGVCSECGQKCEIPFEPVEGRPYKCKECFTKSRFKKRFKKKRRDFEVTCSECGVETTVPFKPTQGRPVLCRDCFDKAKEKEEQEKK